MREFKKRISFIILLLSLACGQSTERAREEKRLGVNGEAVYIFNEDNSLWGLFKQEYNGRDYQIFLKDDTISIGSTFKSYINVAKPNFTVQILSPSNHIIKSDKSYGFKEYQFKPETEGTYEYRGVIEYDTIAVPFQYKFVVN